MKKIAYIGYSMSRNISNHGKNDTLFLVTKIFHTVRTILLRLLYIHYLGKVFRSTGVFSLLLLKFVVVVLIS